MTCDDELIVLNAPIYDNVVYVAFIFIKKNKNSFSDVSFIFNKCSDLKYNFDFMIMFNSQC